MKQAGSPSPAQLVLRSGLGALVSLSGALGFFFSLVSVRKDRGLVILLLFAASCALILLGVFVTSKAESRLKSGIHGGDWHPHDLDQLRRLLRPLSWVVGIIYLYGLVVIAIHGGFGRHPHWADVWCFVGLFPVITLSRLHSMLNSKRPPSNAAI